MANKKAGFIVGANAKIKMFGKTIAYATGVSYDMSTDVIPIEVMGKYEVVSYEPVSTRVSGSLTIIRYTKRASENNIEKTASGNLGDGPSEIGDADNNANMHFDPSKLLESQTFDLDIFEIYKQDGSSQTEQVVFRVQDCRLVRRGMTLNKRNALTDSYNFVGILAGDVDGTEVKVGGSGVEDLS